MPALPIRDLDHVFEHTGPGVWKALAGKRLLITGGTGFVGTWLLESLLWAIEQLDLAASVVVLTRDPGRFRKRSPHLAEHPAVELLAGSVQDFVFPAGEFPFVIHAATERHFEPGWAHPASTFDLDVAATRRVLEFARSHGTRRLLFTSSGAVYGPQPSEMTHIPEDYPGAPPTTGPGTAYGQAKRVSEFLCAMYARQFGFDAPIARLFAFVGPHLPLDANYAVGNFIGDAIEGGPIRVKGDGTPYRSYLYAADLAVWLWTILVRGESARPYNVGSGDAIAIGDLAKAVARATTNAPVEIAEKAVPGAPAARYVPSVERARTELGLQRVVPLDEGIRRTYEWARAGALSPIDAFI
ncbi:MAG TPA: NAD-dependent epimerase/dehydratase family protein [Bryobacteraceae bacterium]|nr:NAD-dependent epimerase/dehydratase family protein [Bryobacteraceae bacterium]